MDKELFDREEVYCRMLGHYLPFKYCRNIPDRDGPCRKIRDCWFDRIPIDEYLQEHLDEKGWQSLREEPPGRMSSLMDIIEQARQRVQAKKDSGDQD